VDLSSLRQEEGSDESKPWCLEDSTRNNSQRRSKCPPPATSPNQKTRTGESAFTVKRDLIFSLRPNRRNYGKNWGQRQET